MKIDFRQGIVTYPVSSNNQVFLAKVGSYVNLQTANGRTDIAFAFGSENYILSETTDVNNAWGPLLPNTNYWLYWDIDLLTAVRTFGFTILAPIVSSIQPSGVNDQHWFSLVDNKMYVYQSGQWRAVLRVFAALVNNSIFTNLGAGFAGRPFAGSQVGLNTPNTPVGRIIIDNVGQPVRKSTGSFFTTEDEFFVNGSSINALRPDSSVLNASAVRTIAKYQIVKFTRFGKIDLASYNDLQSVLTAITLEDIPVNNTGQLCIQGVVVNPLWDFPTVGAQLWVTGSGELTDIDPHLTDPILHVVGKVAIARVISPTSIYFTQGLGGKGDSGTPPAATDAAFGISKLSVAAVDIENPIAVGDNDPRLIPGVLDSLSDVVVPTPSVGDLLEWNGTNWVNQTPAAPTLDGLDDVIVPTPTSGDLLEWNGINWVNYTLPYDLAFYLPSTPFDINAISTGFLSARTVILSSLANNVASCSTVPTTDATTFNINVNGVTKITVEFAVGLPSGTITFTAGPTVTVNSGDVVTVNTTAIIDAVIAGIGITLVGITA